MNFNVGLRVCFPSITGPGLIGIDWGRSARISQTPVIKSKCGVALLKHKDGGGGLEGEAGEEENTLLFLWQKAPAC